MKYRKKPVVIEAFQFPTPDFSFPDWFYKRPGTTWGNIGFSVETLEGVMHGQVGDWVIKGVAGEVYPCKPDIFEQTYEEVK